ncbi:MAG TPA: hypothetical protein DCS43_00795 [Verrucomicrobia bacterium]|nr:hypothetical protein [Verrucomicrobiota bacterium]
MSCFYLIASLPSVTLGQPLPMTPDAFKALCQDQLGLRDQQAVGVLCDGPDFGETAARSTHPFVVRWQARETQLRNAVARMRAARHKGDAAGAIRSHTGFDTAIEDGVEEAFTRSNPLEREEALDQLRWRILDELAGVDPFATSVVMAYAVKLRLAQRWAAHDEGVAMGRVEKAISIPGFEGASPAI